MTHERGERPRQAASETWAERSDGRAAGPVPGRSTRAGAWPAGRSNGDAGRSCDREMATARRQLDALLAANAAGDHHGSCVAAAGLRSALLAAEDFAARARDEQREDASAMAARVSALEVECRPALELAFVPSAAAIREAAGGAGRALWDREVAAWRSTRGRGAAPDVAPRLPAAMQDALTTETGAPLPDAAAWSRRIGADVSGAHLVTGPKAAAAASSIGAPAFTVGHRIFLGSTVTPAHEQVMRHELVHVAQQRGASMPDLGELELTSPDHHVEQEARGAEASDRDAAPIAATGRIQIAPYGFLGRMGPGGGSGIPGPRSLQLDAFKYFERHGKRHFAELKERGMGALTLSTGSPYATWAAGDASSFAAWFANDLLSHLPARPWDLLQQTLAPADVWKLIDTGRDAANPDDPAQANEYQLGVTLELQKAYRERLHEALARLMPRIVREWNRRTLADHAERSKKASIPIPEHPESNYPGVGILQSHPIDRHVLRALSVMGVPLVEPDFAAYRKAFPGESKPRGPRDQPSELRKVRFAWQAPNQARRWIQVVDPIDARPEEVAKELFGDSTLTYLVTAAPPLFGFDIRLHSFVPPYEKEFSKFASSKGATPGLEILSGPRADDAALNQAAGFTAEKVSGAAVIQQLDLVVKELGTIAANAASWITSDKDVHEAIARAEARKQKIAHAADGAEAARWNAQAREQLDIAGKCERAMAIAGALFRSNPEAKEARDLAWEIGKLYFQAAAHSDLVVTARQQLDEANRRLLALPADSLEAQFRWIRRAILASQKNARTGKDDPFVKQLDDKETRLRLELVKIRDRLLTDPLAVGREIERITKEMKELATAAAAVRNIDACNEAFIAVKEAKSATGWIRSLASNPITGSHGNDRLEALAGRAEEFQAEWDAILRLWKDGKQDEAAKALDAKARTDAWKQFFGDVAKEIKDQAKYDAWMTFALLVGIAIVTGFAGALLEPLAAAAVGPVLGFVVTATTEAAAFTTMSYLLVDKHPSLRGFGSEFAKNVVVFGVLKGVGKGWGALEKLLGVEMRSGEVITQFATLNGIALYEANRDKAKRGEPLTEGEILEISFDNLIFTIAVALGGKALAPAFGRWRLRGRVGQDLAQMEALHAEVESLAAHVKGTKDRAAAEKLLDRQRELLEAERRFLEGLQELTKQGWERAKQHGMTREQFDAIGAADKDLADATRGLREAEIMSKLEPVTRSQYLCEPGKPFDEARDHYRADKTNQVTETASDGGIRSFEVRLPDGSKLRVSERAGKPGEVTTATRRAATPGGEPPPPRPEEVAKAHGIDAAQVKAFEALYKADAPRLLEWLQALRSRPDLANRLLAQLGESAVRHVKPAGDGMVSIHGELDISAAKLGSLKDADIAKLVKVCEARGPVAEYEYFESSGTGGGKPGARLRFKSRLETRAKDVAKNILDSLGIKPGDARAKLFEGMSEGDAIRLWDLFNERAYKDAVVRKQATEWAFSKSPKSAREFVAEVQFYDAEVSNHAAKIFADAKVELASQIAKGEAAQGGRRLTATEVKAITRIITDKHLGRSLDDMGPAAERAAKNRALENMGQSKTLADGTKTTIGAEAADLAWKVNLDAQAGANAAGAKNIGVKTDAELPAHIKSIADMLSFSNEADGSYHAHKHAKELSTPPLTTVGEVAAYLKEARMLVRDSTGVVRQNQNGTRSVVFEANGMRAIVHVGAEGNVSIATYGKGN